MAKTKIRETTVFFYTPLFDNDDVNGPPGYSWATHTRHPTQILVQCFIDFERRTY